MMVSQVPRRSNGIDDVVREVRFERGLLVGVENLFPCLNEARRTGAESVAVVIEQRIHAVAHRVFVA